MAQTKNILKASVVSKALRDGTPCILQDGGSLVLKITGKNKGKWQYRGRKKGSRTLIDLACGDAPEIGLSEARAKRDKFKLLLKQGINPNQLKRENQEKDQCEETPAQKTVRAVANEYLATRQDMTAKTWQGEKSRIFSHAAPLLDLGIANVRRGEHLKPLIDELVQHNKFELAKRVAGALGRIFRYAMDCGYIDVSPAERLSSIIPRQTSPRKHYAAQIDKDSCQKLFSKIWKYAASYRSDPFLVRAIKILCYVPIRCSNLIESKWEDIDLEEKIWNFPKTKNGRQYSLPISKQVYDIFLELQDYKCNNDMYCFPGRSEKGHISNGGLRSILRNAEIQKDEQTIHGFRSTFQSICLEMGIPKILTERALFHVAGGETEQAYNRTTYLGPTRAVMQWWADTVDAMRDGKQLPDIPEILRLGGAYQ